MDEPDGLLLCRDKADGTIAVPAGKELDKSEILNMDYFIQGAQGKLPNKS